MKKPDPFLISESNAPALGLERTLRASIDIEFEIPLIIFKAENSVEANAQWEAIQKEAMTRLLVEMDQAMRAAYGAYLEESKNKGVIPDAIYPTDEESDA